MGEGLEYRCCIGTILFTLTDKEIKLQCCQAHGFIHNLWTFLRGRMDEGKSIEFFGFLNVFDLTQ